MSEALAAIFPATTLQTCIVHLIRHSLDYTTWKERKLLAAALRPIYTAPSAETRRRGAGRVSSVGPWGSRFPTVVAAWRRAWTHVIPFFAFPPEVRRVIYTTNAPRERPRAAPEDHQNARSFPDRRGRDETALAGAAKHHAALDACRSKPWREAMIGIRRALPRSVSPPSQHRMSAPRMDAAVAVDAKNAPTATWKTAQRRGFPQRPHASSTGRQRKKKEQERSTRLTHKIPEHSHRQRLVSVLLVHRGCRRASHADQSNGPAPLRPPFTPFLL